MKEAERFSEDSGQLFSPMLPPAQFSSLCTRVRNPTSQSKRAPASSRFPLASLGVLLVWR